MSVRESMLETLMLDLADHHGVCIFHSKKNTSSQHEVESGDEPEKGRNLKKGGIVKRNLSLPERY